MRIVILVLTILTGPQTPPPDVYVDKGACPGEGCQYDERWVAKEVVGLRKEPNQKSPVVATVRPGEGVRTVTGEVHTVPGRFVVRVPLGELKPGDEVLVYTYLGEGHFRVRHNGQVKEADLEFSPLGGSGGTRCEVESRCWGTLQQELQFTWWIKVRTASRTEGWVADAGKFLQPSSH